MVECRNCGAQLPGEAHRYGARCPRCREPLYERAAVGTRVFQSSEGGTAMCATHANNPSVGTCQRCGNFLCGVCRTRWYERVLCLTCMGRILEAKESRPEDARAHRRQALLALVFGIAAWVLILLGGLCLLLVQSNTANAESLALMAFLVFLSSLLPSLFGVGQGAAAIRARGERMILATCGLILCAAHVGMILGGFLFTVWAT
jgi:hypothetical protein